MGCGNCSSGCGKSCSSSGCSTGGCNKLNSFDWLSFVGIESNSQVVEIRFKGGRKSFFRNPSNLILFTGDPIVVETGGGYHVGFVSLQGEMVRLQMKKKNADDTELFNILRKATSKDLEKYEQSKNRELSILYRAREIISELKLEMKLSDIEFQADGGKATFYYSADDRVDFRELIKQFASEFKVRIEMKQISLRQEASRLGGIGVCGRELCCSSWLTDYKNINTSAAKYQNLSLNPAKLSGQCGRLKCCLNYELDTYVNALKDIPTIDHPIKTKKGNLKLQKTDIFRKIMWFAFQEESNWIPLSVKVVSELIELNKKGIIPEDVAMNPAVKEEPKLVGFQDNLELDLTKIASSSDKSRNTNNKRRKNNKNRNIRNSK